jgi:ABC-type phosphate/phosphonate transport system substrate-binding protein
MESDENLENLEDLSDEDFNFDSTNSKSAISMPTSDLTELLVASETEFTSSDGMLIT